MKYSMRSQDRIVGRLGMATLVILAQILILLGNLSYPAPIGAASVVTPTAGDNAGAKDLASAMLANQSALVSARFDTIPPSGTPHGTAGALSFFPTHGGTFGVMTTGNAMFADAPNESSNAGADLGGGNVAGRGATAFDVTVLAIVLAAPANANCLRFDFAFYSEEFSEYVGSAYNDTFIAELDSTTWTANANTTISAPNNFAFDDKGAVVSINSTGDTSMNAINSSGTTYDGGTVLLEAARYFTAGGSPQHTLYLSLLDQGDPIFDSAAFIDNIRFETVANQADCKAGAQKKRTPLILVPGIGGSQLINADTKAEIWPQTGKMIAPGGEGYLKDLRLHPDGPFYPDGPSPHPEVKVKVAVGDILRYEGDCSNPPQTTWKCASIYGDTIVELTKADYKEGKSPIAFPNEPAADLYVFPYDWRLDVRTNGEKLLTFIDAVRAKTQSPKVDILAHSMGGMVTFAALATPASENKVRKVVTLGTPVLGSTKTLSVLKYRSACFFALPIIIPIVGINVNLTCQIDRQLLQEVLLNIPGAYQLLPGEAFDEAVRPPLVIDQQDRPYNEWSVIARSNDGGFALNGALLDKARDYHRESDFPKIADPNVQVFRVIGDGQATIDYIEKTQIGLCSWKILCTTLPPLQKDQYDHTVKNGDGTVPLHAADLHNPGKGFDRRNGIPNAYVDAEHGDLPKNASVLAFVNSYLNGAPQASVASASAASAVAPRQPHDPRQATASSAATANIASSFGLRDAPLPLSGIMVEVAGAATGAVSDPTGRKIGIDPSGQPTAAIPGGSYEAGEDLQYFFFTGIDAYTAAFAIGGDAPVRIRVQTYANDQLTTQASFTLNVPAGAKTDLGFTSGQDLGTLKLRIDQNGDGIIDEERGPDSVVSGAESSDRIAPTTTATVTPTGSNQRQITLTATDNPGGSGVAATYYHVGDAALPQIYAGPFTVPNDATVRFASVDRAGNTEARSEIPLPTAPPTPSFADVPADYWAYAQIGQFAQRGITTGCGDDDQRRRLYCPERGVTRAEMAVFITRTLGQDKAAPPATPTFADVPTDYWASGQIEAFARLGITTGCGTNSAGQRLYCPDRGVTRAEMAAFLDRAKGQPELTGGAPTFADVPTGYWAYGWIERFFTLGVTTGCGTNAAGQRLYCPDRGVTRAEMAVFIIRAYPGP